jgi:DNA polymerase-3 subunit delta
VGAGARKAGVIDINGLKEQLKRRSVKPFYIARGDDEFLKSRVVFYFKELVDADFSQMNVVLYDAEPEVSDLISECMTPPLFSSYRVIVVKGWENELGEKGATALAEYLEKPSQETVLVVFDDKKKLEKFSRYAEMISCSGASRKDASDWIKRKVFTSGAVITEPAVAKIIEMTRLDMAKIAAETEKLLAYSEGRITEKDVLEIVSAELEYKIYDLSDAVASGNGTRAFELLSDMMASGFGETVIIGQLTKQYRRMFYASQPSGNTAELAAKLKVQPFAVQKAAEAARKYSPGALKRAVEFLNMQEYRFKSGKTGKNAYLYDTVLKLLTAAKKYDRTV